MFSQIRLLFVVTTYVFAKSGGPSYSFTPSSQQLGTASVQSNPVIGDFNRDGIPDIAYLGSASGSYLGAGVSVLLGIENGTFSAPVVSLSNLVFSTDTVRSADVNGDGIPDLVVYDGTPNRAPQLDILLGNGDGRLDLLLMSEFGQMLLLNGGPGPFLEISFSNPATSYLTAPLTFSVDVGNAANAAATSGNEVSLTLATGPTTTITSIGGAGWSCSPAGVC